MQGCGPWEAPAPEQAVLCVWGGAGRADLEFTRRVAVEVALHTRPCGVFSNKSHWHLGGVESSHGLRESWGAGPLRPGLSRRSVKLFKSPDSFRGEGDGIITRRGH